MAAYNDDVDERGRPIIRTSQWSETINSSSSNQSSYQSRHGGGDRDREDRRGGGGYGGNERSGGGGGYQRREYGGGDRDRGINSNDRCYNCQQTGHKSYECPEPKNDQGREPREQRDSYNRGPRREYQPARGGNERSGGGGYQSRESGGGYRGGGNRSGGRGYGFSDRDSQPREPRGPIKCFNCGGEGHKSTECPDEINEENIQAAIQQRRAERPQHPAGERSSYQNRDRRDGPRERREPLDSHLDELKIDDPERPRLHLAPKRTQPSESALITPPVADVYTKKSPSSNPFGAAKPREMNLIAAGKPIRSASPPARRLSSSSQEASATTTSETPQQQQ